MKMYKSTYNKIGLIAAAFVIFLSCDSVLNLDPLDQPSDAAVWSDAALTQAFVNDIYLNLTHGMSEVLLGIHTDEAAFTHIGESDQAKGNINPTNLYDTTWGRAWWTGPTGNGNLIWSNIYAAIRKTNIFFKNFDPELFDDQALAQQLIGEVHFIRAMKYHDLLKLHGGVPIVDQVFELDSDMQLPRNTFEEVFEFILADIDEAASRLNWLPSEPGKASRGAALALKSRVLTYAASDLFYNQGAWSGGYANPELIGFTDQGRQQQLWQQARDVAKQIIDEGPYSLYNQNPDPTQNFQDIWLQGGGSEAIFTRFNLQDQPREQGIGWQGAGGNWGMVEMGRWHGPNGYFLWGGSTPQQALVDDFETLDGEKFDWSNPVHAQNPYENRDPRFAATVMYTGFQWRPRPVGTQDFDPIGKFEGFLSIRCNGCPEEFSRPGIDTRRSPIEDWNATRTGYVLNKFMDPNVEHWNFPSTETPWHFFRYSEVLLNYAEAQINLGNEGEAKWAINEIRNRAGMPEINDSGQALVERYRNERRVELAFEDHRYYDVRRWMIAPETEDKDAHGIYLHAEYDYDPTDPHGGFYNYTFSSPPPGENVPDEVTFASGNPNIGIMPVWPRAWNPATYFLPIHRDEMNRNTALVQNPLYD